MATVQILIQRWGWEHEEKEKTTRLNELTQLPPQRPNLASAPLEPWACVSERDSLPQAVT